MGKCNSSRKVQKEVSIDRKIYRIDESGLMISCEGTCKMWQVSQNDIVKLWQTGTMKQFNSQMSNLVSSGLGPSLDIILHVSRSRCTNDTYVWLHTPTHLSTFVCWNTSSNETVWLLNHLTEEAKIGWAYFLMGILKMEWSVRCSRYCIRLGYIFFIV